MTQQQRSALDRAIERARRDGITILARSTRQSDGAPIYLVTSASEPGHHHIVAVYRGRLTCTCQAGEQGAICKHKGKVHLALVAEHAAAKAAHRAEARMPSQRRDTGPTVYNAAPFSIYK